jgi:ADP-dependent NAD(P)H-hydrate dehydratase / NAD(P)H-hydrate epimerase
MISRLLPAIQALPVWPCAGIRILEHRVQCASATPLMDLAGLAIARLAMALAPHATRVCVVAGPGNNGGDGLEAAMHLHRWGVHVHVRLLAEPANLPADAQRAWSRACAAGVEIDCAPPTDILKLGPQDLCIDALLGIGVNRAPEGDVLKTIDWLNASPALVLSVDLPSGLNADSGQPPGVAVKADHTLTLLGIKPGLLMGQGRDACGELWLAPLGLPAQAPSWHAPHAELNPPPKPIHRRHASHKGTHGDVAIVGGESLGPHTSMAGAALLAAQAALHGGAGRVMLSLLADELPLSAPADLMHRSLDTLDLPTLTVVAGCGGGRAIARPLPRLLQLSARLVLDADALNRLSEDAWLQDLLGQRTTRGQDTVLTPHPLEAARLLNCDTQLVQSDRLSAAQRLAERLQCCVVLKGSGTVIAAPGRLPRINPTGNGLLATGGTGDVLAGLIGARLATGQEAFEAACSAVWTHGQEADRWPSGLALSASRLANKLR